MLGWGQGQLQRRVDGRSKFTIDELDQIEQVFGMDPLYLLGYTNDRRQALTRGADPGP